MIGFSPLVAETILQNRYKIHNLLGKGGMGAVYLAEHLLSGDEVAVKQTFYGDHKELSEAFYNEAKLLARLKHLALPKVTDYFAENNSQFLVMELIHGDDLGSSFDYNGKCEPMPLEDALKMSEQLFETLAYLHSQNILHRDLKPANLKITTNGQLKVLDFGAAKGSLTETTVYSVLVCSPAYAPPEQIHQIGTTERSDVFSAAATIYHLLAGEPPPSAPKRENIIRTKKFDPLRPINELNTKVPSSISEALQKAMSLEAENRFSTAEMLQKFQTKYLSKHRNTFTNSSKMEFVLIRAGQFQMGDVEDVIDKIAETRRKQWGFDEYEDIVVPEMLYSRELPARIIEIPYSFYIGKFSVTQAEWRTLITNNPSFIQGDTLPVDGVSWFAAQKFIEQLNKRNDGYFYRLPSEAEWEYACRAGTTTEFAFGDNLNANQANFNGKDLYVLSKGEKSGYRKRTTPVGSFEPNAWGLYDMHGNVWEWCEDIFLKDFQLLPKNGLANLSYGDENLRVLRGGSWGVNAFSCRSAYRSYAKSDTTRNCNGFRVVAVPKIK